MSTTAEGRSHKVAASGQPATSRQAKHIEQIRPDAKQMRMKTKRIHNFTHERIARGPRDHAKGTNGMRKQATKTMPANTHSPKKQQFHHTFSTFEGADPDKTSSFTTQNASSVGNVSTDPLGRGAITTSGMA